MRVLICGSRDWDDIRPIELLVVALVAKYGKQLVVIHGGARGADSIAGSLCAALGVQVEEFSAEWQKYGKKAGPLRNIRMLEKGEPDQVFAFSDDLSVSVGTRHMCSIASKAGLDVFVIGRYATR